MLYRQSTSVELATATYEIPPDTQHPEFVVPLEVTDFIIQQYSLDDPRRRVIDPFAGNADFIDRVRRKEGRCDGIELVPEQFDLALARLLPPTTLTVGGREMVNGEMLQGDCTKTATKLINLGYHAILTSMPFTLMHELRRGRDLRIAHALNMMLHSDGVLIVDSAEHAERDGQALTPAADTIDYLVNPRGNYANGYFNFVASHKFKVNDPPPGCDSQFTELVFVKRWLYYPGALASLATLQSARTS